MNSKFKCFIILSIFLLAFSIGSAVAADNATVELESADESVSIDNDETALAVANDGVIGEDEPVQEEPVELVANFTNDVSEGKDSVTVQFTDKSTGNVTSWLWDFGDGTNSSEQNPKHTYSSYGIFDVGLTVSNGTASSNITKTGLIDVYSSNDAIVNPSFESGTTGWTVSGVTTSSRSAYQKKDGNYILYINGASGGYVSQLINFDVIKSISFWTYTRGESGEINVWVDDEKIFTSSIGTSYSQLTINTENIIGDHIFKIEGSRLVIIDLLEPVVSGSSASFRISSYSIDNKNVSISFLDTSLGRVDKWLWDFGDGSVSTEKNPTHIYSEPGKYDVQLTVFNKDTNVSRNNSFVFSNLDNLNFTVNATQGKDNLTVQFNSVIDGIVET